MPAIAFPVTVAPAHVASHAAQPFDLVVTQEFSPRSARRLSKDVEIEVPVGSGRVNHVPVTTQDLMVEANVGGTQAFCTAKTALDRRSWRGPRSNEFGICFSKGHSEGILEVSTPHDRLQRTRTPYEIVGALDAVGSVEASMQSVTVPNGTCGALTLHYYPNVGWPTPSSFGSLVLELRWKQTTTEPNLPGLHLAALIAEPADKSPGVPNSVELKGAKGSVQTAKIGPISITVSRGERTDIDVPAAESYPSGDYIMRPFALLAGLNPDRQMVILQVARAEAKAGES